MSYIEGNLYKINYKDIDEDKDFLGVYKGKNKNGSHAFVSENYGHMLYVGKKDINKCEMQ